jgi:arginine/lysine/ornithine decarboxylase
MSVATPIYDFITDHRKKDAVSFHMPGHKGSRLYRRFGYHEFLDHIMDYDITEIAGADNLFQTEGVIKGVQDHYARLYGCKKSYILINGSSGGNIASILASVRKGKQLIMARNCHKSVFNALTLGGIRPVYAYPETIGEFGISGAVSPAEIERLIRENPDAEAVLITSPNYYGVCSDVRAIAETAHRYGKVLIVDEAHGAHLHFSDELPLSALQSGADLVINSTHKTLASFTQSAVLHYNSELVDQYLLEDKLQCIQSTSPSYILMTSLDINADILEKHGDVLMKEWTGNLTSFYERIAKIPGVSTMGKMAGLDWTKINLSLGELGINGAQLDKILLNDYDIFIELFTGDWIMAMSGIGNTKDDYDRLADALEDISRKVRESGPEIYGIGDKVSRGGTDCSAEAKHDAPSGHMAGLPAPPKQAELFDIPAVKKRVGLEDSEGMICAASIIPYPPGIPLLCPGERIEADAIAYIRALRDMGEKVIGVNEAGEILVGE